jgi:4-amino-4-deoxy-L-arabinose transferase-like glycosyltransferase
VNVYRLRTLSGSWSVFATFFLIGVFVIGAYVHFEPYDGRSHDRGNQLAYIALVLRDHRVPAAKDCWECHHPPAYYAMAAAALGLVRGTVPPEHHDEGKKYRGARTLQVLGGAIALTTLGVWLLTVRTVLRSRYEQILASAFVTFWPTLAIDGTPIGNDGLVCLVTSTAVCLLAYWGRYGRAWALVAGFAVAGLASDAKINGLVAVPIALALLLARVMWPQGTSRWPRGATAAVAMLAATLGGWYWALQYWKQGRTSIDFRTMEPPVVTGWPQFTQINWEMFWKTPFVVWGGPSSDEFWSFFFRSSLFGEFGSNNPATQAYGYLMYLTAVACVPFLVIGVVSMTKRGWQRTRYGGSREIVLAFVGLVASMIALRTFYPYKPHNDFRFCLAAAAPGAILVATGFGVARRHLAWRWPHLASLPGWLAVAFSALSLRVLFYWS